MSIEIEKLTNIVEAALLAFGQPLSVDRLMSLFTEEEQVSRQDIREALQQLQQACEGQGIELVEVGSGFRYQARKDYAQWVAKLWEEKPPRYSRALLETLVLVAYRQPITRAEIEDIRGVSVSTHIMKTLQERDWVRVVGHKDVPGKPALYATTKAFLDYFNLKSLDELPSLMEIRDLDKISAEIDKQSQEFGAEQTEAAAQELIEDEDVERLLPDGDVDHGDGVDDSVEVVVAQREVNTAEATDVAALSESAVVVAISDDEQETEVEELTQTAEIVAMEIANDSQIDDKVSESVPLAEAPELESLQSSDEHDVVSAEVETLETEYTESAYAEADDMHAETETDSTDDAGFSTAKYGLRAAEHVEPVRDDSEIDDEDEQEHHSERFSAAEPNT